MVNGLDLCKEILGTMASMGFSEDTIKRVSDDYRFSQAEGKNTLVQKVLLTTYYNYLFVMSPELPPTRIRVAISAAADPLEWLNDIKLIVLRFIQDNQEHFYPTHH